MGRPKANYEVEHINAKIPKCLANVLRNYKAELGLKTQTDAIIGLLEDGANFHYFIKGEDNEQ